MSYVKKGIIKMKKLLFVIGAIVVISSASYYGYHRYRQAQVNQSQANTTTDKYTEYDKNMADMKWLQRYPQLKTVASGSMTATIDKLRTSESISELIGPIDNAYGVRNDILDKILSIVPESNPQMLRAAIKYAYYDNLLFYSATDDDKLLQISHWALASSCAALFDSSKNINTFSKTNSIISSGMRDTRRRYDYISNVEQTTFVWHVMSSGLSSSEEIQYCNEGSY